MKQKTHTSSKYDTVKQLTPTKFRRLTGVKPTIFAQMVVILKRADKQLRKRGGKPKLIVEDRLLLALEYLRDYPTYFRLGQNYSVTRVSHFQLRSRASSASWMPGFMTSQSCWYSVVCSSCLRLCFRIQVSNASPMWFLWARPVLA